MTLNDWNLYSRCLVIMLKMKHIIKYKTAAATKTSTGRYVTFMICCAVRVSSTTVITDNKGDALRTCVNSFVRAGITAMKTCGKIIRRQIGAWPMPSARAASM